MSNKNFGEPWEGKIERIRENLREGRYALEDGIFPIVKELIQNAEDARAGRLLIAWDEGLPDAQHRLLCGPALLAINDGSFDPANSRAIREMGLSSKAADSSSIGKFGLGMKSVFHVGEVFFFVAVGEDGGRIDADIRNPWSADVGGLHPDWDDFAEGDVRAMQARVRSLFGEGKWFCLWVPLRRCGQSNGVDPIEPFFPGDQAPSELLGATQTNRLAPLLPLLSQLQTIELRLGQRATFTCRVERESSRRSPLAALPTAPSRKPRSFGGAITLIALGQEEQVVFAGEECCPSDEQLDQIARHGKWPRRFATDPATGKSIQVAEKASPHAAVCCVASRTPEGCGQVRLQWAVFLPLGKPETIPVPHCSWSFDLFLHGWFFPNSGRTAVESLDAEERKQSLDDSGSAAVRHRWNHRLARCGTLPLVPTTLAAIARRCEWDDPTTASITAALQRSRLVLDFGAEICERDNWIRRLTPDGTCSWQAVPTGTPLYTVPDAVPETQAMMVFPALREMAAKHVILFYGSPRLTASPPQRWPASAGPELLRRVPSDNLASSPDRLEYLTRFLDQSAVEQAWSVHADELVALVLSALSAARGNVPQEARPALQRFLQRLPGGRRVRLRFEITDEFAGDVYAVLCDSTDSVVWIPDGIDRPDATCTGRLSAAEALRILGRLSEWGQRKLSAAENERFGAVVAQVIRSASELGRLLETAGGMELFSGTNCRDRKDIRLSWNSIVQHHQRRVLFVKPSPMAYQLQEAIQDTDIILISANLTQSIYGEQADAPAQCREGQLLATLAGAEKPRLAATHSRRKLFDTLLKFREGRRERSFRECVRYLMHGEPARFSAADSLLVQGHDGSTVWLRMARLALEAVGELWRIVDPAFSTAMSEEDRREFGVEVVDPEVALRLASAVSATCFDSLRPTEAEYRDLLRHIPDDDLLRRLPIHQDMEGRFFNLCERCYWQSDRALPAGLHHDVRILKRASDEPTWKRQRQLADPLNPAAIIGIALAQTEPASHWQLVMDCLSEADHLTQETIHRLRTTAWVPTGGGTVVKPEEVIHVWELRDDVARLVSDYPGIFVDPERLAPAVREHRGCGRFLDVVVPARSEALVMLGTLLLENDQNPVGEAGIALEDWLEAFHDDDGTLFPCIHLLRTAHDRLTSAARATFVELGRQIPEARTQELLDWLRSVHSATNLTTRRSKIVRVFGQYLRTMVNADNFIRQVQSQMLPAKDGAWRPASELCLANDGVAVGHVLDRQVEDELAPCFLPSLQDASPFPGSGPNARGHLREPDWNVQAAAGRLRAYFDTWRDVIPNEQIGGFLALLGDDEGVRELAQEFLGRYRTLEETREKFGLPQAQCGRDPATGQLIIEDGPTMISNQRVVVEIASEPTVPVLNLLGEPIHVPRNERPSTLFVGYGSRANPFPHRVDQGLRVRCFRLNAVDPRAFGGTELSLLLRDSAIKFIAEAYNSFEQQTKLSATWDELSASDQLDIRVTQSRIIEHGFLILDQYGLRSDPELARVLERWDTAERLKAERETQGDSTRRSSGRNPERELQAAREQLRDLLENRQETQHHILAAIRHRIADYYQYKPDSIPFELFQNADDAYAELFCFFPEASSRDQAADPFFRLVVRDNRVIFLQAGRRINQYPIDRDRSAHGFDNDLWKMSVLSLSNKGQPSDQPAAAVTGKFGLGFKSVFLACDRPRLLSGRLAFEFVGGIYPRRLIGNERSSLDGLRKQEALADAQVTVIELELRGGLGVEQVVERFERLAHILVVFARQIRRCVSGVEGRETRWQPIDVPGVSGCRSAEIKPLEPGRGIAARRVLLFESDAGALLFALGGRGFEPFEAEIPTVWVTAPTEERLQVGFVVNGPSFVLDVGRAQLARDPDQNREPAVRLGQQFGERIARFFSAFDAAASRGPVRQALRLAADVTPFDLWNSLWDLLVVAVSQRAIRDEPAERLIRDVLWASTDSGAAGLVAAHPVIPVRLPGKRFERQLVALDDIRYSVRGVMTRDDGFALACAVEWPGVKERLGNGCLVAHQKVIEPLRLVCPRLVSHIDPIGLPEMLRWELTHDDVNPKQAERFGAVIDKRLLDQCDPIERQALDDHLGKLEFKAMDGRFHPARRLLVAHVPPGTRDGKQTDESRRAAFAPRDRVLSAEYGADGLSFFETSRGKLDAPVQELAGWVLAARDRATRQAALDYLADGELGPALQNALKERGLAGTWLAELAASDEFMGMDIQQQGRLLGLLPLTHAERILDVARESLSPQPACRPDQVLRRIHDWWRDVRRTELVEYERRLYPTGGLRFVTDTAEEHSLQRRKDWMSLFLVGLTHTMGRTVAEQHRGFLRRCDREGWLDMFALSDRDPGHWMRWVDHFLDGQIEESRFLQWMKQFVGIYQLSRHLDDYIEAFLAVERLSHPFALTQVTNTRASSVFQGGGVSAPPLSRVLGMGQCFVLRELVRRGVLANKHAHVHCFVPVARVRRMLLQMGCEELSQRQRPWEWSRAIHRFLVGHLGPAAATFHGDFDIPLQVVAEDPELQAKFFTAAINFEDDESGLPFGVGDEAASGEE